MLHKKMDLVFITDPLDSLVQKKSLSPGVYIFDSYEVDGNCYISNKESLCITYLVHKSDILPLTFGNIRKFANVMVGLYGKTWAKKVRIDLLWNVRINTNNRLIDRTKRWQTGINYFSIKS